MIPLEEAQERLLALATPLETEMAGIHEAAGRYLASDILAKRTQPAKDLSAMDGYAVAHATFPGPWQVTGEAAAGSSFNENVAADSAARIFTGAPLPGGTDSILIQENAKADDGKLTPLADVTLEKGQHVRRAGSDFCLGDKIIEAGAKLNAAHIGLATLAGLAEIPVHRKPRIAILSTGDELVPPGQVIGEDQIPASNGVMLAAMLQNLPCEIVENRIVPDDLEQMKAAFKEAKADIIITIGGASVGDHDLVRPALDAVGAELDFWKVAMRPGKPVTAGKLADAVVLGLPGNPVSAYVTAFLFLMPMLRQMSGSKSPFPLKHTAKLEQSLPANGPRANFIRALVRGDSIAPLPSRDSAILTALSAANALIYRPISAAKAEAGNFAEYFALG